MANFTRTNGTAFHIFFWLFNNDFSDEKKMEIRSNKEKNLKNRTGKQNIMSLSVNVLPF